MRLASISAAVRGPRPSARCDPIEPRRGRVRTTRGSRFPARACRCEPAARPSSDTSAPSPSLATWPTVATPRSCSLPAVTGPTPQSRSTGSGSRKARSRSGATTRRPFGFATPLATLARNFVRATPTVIGSPTRSCTSRRSRAAISAGVPGDPLEPADVEEGLVDREALDQRRRVLEHGVHRLAGLGVGRHPGRDDDRLGAQPAGLAAAHGGADAVHLRLVARGEHHAAADDDRPPAQARVIALLDRRVERVEVGVQDRRLGPHRTYVRTQVRRFAGRGARRRQGRRRPLRLPPRA